VSDPEIEHWVETKAQSDELAKANIKANIAPSFLENIDDFPLFHRHLFFWLSLCFLLLIILVSYLFYNYS
jgi:hypothetical protein